MSKSRKIYKRQGIVHVCYSGPLFAPLDSEATGVDLDEPLFVDKWVKAEVVDGTERRAIKVFQKVEDKYVREVWYEVEIPAKRKATKKAA